MDIELEPGTYVVAVSGGVDSMVLLDLLVKQAQSSQHKAHSTMRRYRFIVAHFDHGIRPDSRLDRQLVQAAAERYGLDFVYDRAELGPAASEAAARKARYGFLRKTQKTCGARAIITAHHQDDLIETAIHNLLRGTGRKGLTSLSHNDIVRPLLDVPKSKLIRYAKEQGLDWREDLTNFDTRYRRNYIRHKIVPKLSSAERAQLVKLLEGLLKLNREIDGQIADILRILEVKGGLDRAGFIALPHSVARETMAAWLRSHGIRSFDRKLLERLVVAAKTLANGKQVDVDVCTWLAVTKKELALKPSHR